MRGKHRADDEPGESKTAAWRKQTNKKKKKKPREKAEEENKKNDRLVARTSVSVVAGQKFPASVDSFVHLIPYTCILAGASGQYSTAIGVRPIINSAVGIIYNN